MSSLHADIMNLPVKMSVPEFRGEALRGYKVGHRDARHAAAELAIAADSRIEELEAALKASQDLVDRLVWQDAYRVAEEANKALGEQS